MQPKTHIKWDQGMNLTNPNTVLAWWEYDVICCSVLFGCYESIAWCLWNGAPAQMTNADSHSKAERTTLKMLCKNNTMNTEEHNIFMSHFKARKITHPIYFHPPETYFKSLFNNTWWENSWGFLFVKANYYNFFLIYNFTRWWLRLLTKIWTLQHALLKQ